MSRLNKIMLVGRLESEAEQKVSTAGDPFVRFVLMVDRPSRQEGMPIQRDEVPVVGWRQAAEQAQALRVGAMVLVDGSILTRSFEQEGVRKYVTEVDARQIQVLTDSSEAPVPVTADMSSSSDTQVMPTESVAGTSSSPVAETPVPVIEPKQTTGPSGTFDFGAQSAPVANHQEKAAGPDISMPPEFGDEVVEDIPF